MTSHMHPPLYPKLLPEIVVEPKTKIRASQSLSTLSEAVASYQKNASRSPGGDDVHFRHEDVKLLLQLLVPAFAAERRPQQCQDST
ncbi:unnamed protein product [Nesidiocoris tenuis]|uniref:Uncharacterized protein n=1 Tax=Nesidiocoris tenuis TaxID=355587 RepID=A0A6H5H925_9HEMI|nr:unnamed protein product [Nesidiocoris tenuis]